MRSKGKNKNRAIKTDIKGSLFSCFLSFHIIHTSSHERSFFQNTFQRKYANIAEHVSPIRVAKNHPTNQKRAPLIKVMSVAGKSIIGRIAYATT